MLMSRTRAEERDSEVCAAPLCGGSSLLWLSCSLLLPPISFARNYSICLLASAFLWVCDYRSSDRCAGAGAGPHHLHHNHPVCFMMCSSAVSTSPFQNFLLHCSLSTPVFVVPVLPTNVSAFVFQPPASSELSSAPLLCFPLRFHLPCLLCLTLDKITFWTIYALIYFYLNLPLSPQPDDLRGGRILHEILKDKEFDFYKRIMTLNTSSGGASWRFCHARVPWPHESFSCMMLWEYLRAEALCSENWKILPCRTTAYNLNGCF